MKLLASIDSKRKLFLLLRITLILFRVFSDSFALSFSCLLIGDSLGSFSLGIITHEIVEPLQAVTQLFVAIVSFEIFQFGGIVLE